MILEIMQWTCRDLVLLPLQRHCPQDLVMWGLSCFVPVPWTTSLWAGVSTTARGEGHAQLQTALIMNQRAMGCLTACDQEFSYRQ